MERITEHVWWHPPGPPDRPSLCAVVGERWTLMLDAGASRAHTREVLDALPTRPSAVVLTHSHWDHVFGAAEIGGLVLAHRRTVPKLVELAARDWSDDGLEGYRYADDIRIELPSPRTVEIPSVDVVFDESLDLDLGGVTVHARHLASDHCDDAVVVHVVPDRLLFLGDALCSAPEGHLTAETTLPLFDSVLAYDAERFVEGHHNAVSARAEMIELIEKGRAAAAGTVIEHDDDSEYFAAAFRAGR